MFTTHRETSPYSETMFDTGFVRTECGEFFVCCVQKLFDFRQIDVEVVWPWFYFQNELGRFQK